MKNMSNENEALRRVIENVSPTWSLLLNLFNDAVLTVHVIACECSTGKAVEESGHDLFTTLPCSFLERLRKTSIIICTVHQV
jgi:hypothetical protein